MNRMYSVFLLLSIALLMSLVYFLMVVGNLGIWDGVFFLLVWTVLVWQRHRL